nr:hypothetical protein [Tanacetum cinerariifolium]
DIVVFCWGKQGRKREKSMGGKTWIHTPDGESPHSTIYYPSVHPSHVVTVHDILGTLAIEDDEDPEENKVDEDDEPEEGDSEEEEMEIDDEVDNPEVIYLDEPPLLVFQFGHNFHVGEISSTRALFDGNFEEPPIPSAFAPRADDPYVMARDAAMAAQEDDDDDAAKDPQPLESRGSLRDP